MFTPISGIDTEADPRCRVEEAPVDGTTARIEISDLTASITLPQARLEGDDNGIVILKVDDFVPEGADPPPSRYRLIVDCELESPPVITEDGVQAGPIMIYRRTENLSG